MAFLSLSSIFLLFPQSLFIAFGGNLFTVIYRSQSHVKVTIPADTYKGQTTPATTYAYYAMVYVRPDLPEDLVYKLVKAMYDHPADIAKVHPAGKEFIAKNALLGADFYKSKNVKFHAGAIKYLKEQNVWDSKYE